MSSMVCLIEGRTGNGLRRFATVSAAVGIGIAGSIGAFAPRTARAEVAITYLANPSDSPTGEEEVRTKEATPLPNGSYAISLATDYHEADGTVDSGSAFIVQPVIDPAVRLTETLFNFSDVALTNIAFVAPDGMYFKASDVNAFSSIFSTVTLADPFLYSDPTGAANPDNGTTVFASIVFSPISGTIPTDGAAGDFAFTFHTPASNDYHMITIPNVTGSPLQTYLAPEPGSLALMAALGGMLLLGAAAPRLRCCIGDGSGSPTAH